MDMVHGMEKMVPYLKDSFGMDDQVGKLLILNQMEINLKEIS